VPDCRTPQHLNIPLTEKLGSWGRGADSPQEGLHRHPDNFWDMTEDEQDQWGQAIGAHIAACAAEDGG
jgi:hypothetical protein